MRLSRPVFLLIGLVATLLFFEGCASRQTARNGKIRIGDVQRLQQIYETSIPAQIRKTFDQTAGHVCSKDHEDCSGCAFTVQEKEKRVDIFTKKFIVVGLEPGSFGGVEATIVFEGVPNAFWLWLYDVDPNEYQLRSIEEIPEPLDEGLARQLQNPAYHRYWL
jgi:hypothetical protein